MVTMEAVGSEINVYTSTTGIYDIITLAHMKVGKHAIAVNIGDLTT